MTMKTKTLAAITGALAISVAYALEVQNYSVDGEHSSISFSVPVAGGLVHLQGRFNRFTAELNYVPNDYEHSSVKAVIDVASLDTGVPGRDHHTLDSEGFNAAKYPHITFVSKKIEKMGNGFDATGDLTLKGVKKEIHVLFHSTGSQTISKGVTLLGFEGSFSINRRDYGMKWEMPHNPSWIGDDVEVHISVLARPS